MRYEKKGRKMRKGKMREKITGNKDEEKRGRKEE